MAVGAGDKPTIPRSQSWSMQRSRFSAISPGSLGLGAFLASLALSGFIRHLTSNPTLVAGQRLSDVFLAGGALIGVLLWLQSPSTIRYPLVGRLFVSSFIGLWVVAALRASIEGWEMNMTVFVAPPLAIMLLAKPLSGNEVTQGLRIFSWSLVAVSIVSLGVGADRSVASSTYETTWPLVDLVGLSHRWAGPFEHVNLAGPVGAYLFVFGLTCGGSQLSRITFLCSGSLIILAAGSRTAAFAAIIGALVVWAVSDRPPFARWSLLSRLGITALTFFAGWAAALVSDPTLNVRVPLWPVFLRLGGANPVFGSGYSGIEELRTQGLPLDTTLALSRGVLPEWVTHAHNEVIDQWARFGGLGVAMLGAFLFIWAILGIIGARVRRATSLSLFGVFITLAVTEVHGEWLYLSIVSSWALLGGLSALVFTSQSEPESTGTTNEG